MIRNGTTRSGAYDSIKILAIFLSLVHQDDFILHILIFLNSQNGLVVVSLMFCIINWHNLCQKELIEFFGHFIVFGLYDWSDIAYNDSTKCFSTFERLFYPYI